MNLRPILLIQVIVDRMRHKRLREQKPATPSDQESNDPQEIVAKVETSPRGYK